MSVPSDFALLIFFFFKFCFVLSMYSFILEVVVAVRRYYSLNLSIPSDFAFLIFSSSLN